MAEIMGKRVSKFEQRGYDYDIEHVPMEARKDGLSLTIIWTCWTFQFATIMAGGMVGQGLTLGKAIAAIIIADVILAILGALMGLMGKRTGLSTAMLTRYSFGNVGTYVPSVVLGLIMFGWLTFCYWIFSLTVSLIIGNAVGPGLGFVIGAIILTIMTVIPVSYGYEGPKWVAYLTIPLFLIPVGIVLALLLNSAGGIGAIAATYVPPKPMSFAFAINVAMAAWLNGTLLAPDWQRLAKSDAGGMAAPAIGLIVGESLVLALGAVTVAATFGKVWNPVEAATHVAGPLLPLVLLVYLIGMYNTNPPTTYSSAVNFANVVQRPKTYPAVVLAVAAPVAACTIQFSVGAYAAMNFFLQALAAVQPPIAGILVAEYFILARGRFPSVHTVKRKFHWLAFVVWAISAYLDQMTRNAYAHAGPNVGLPYGIPGLNGFIISIVLYAVVCLALGVSVAKEKPKVVAAD